MIMRRQGFIGVVAVAAVLVGWAGTALAQAFPATGQTTCWNSQGGVIACAGTGQDGDIQAGAPGPAGSVSDRHGEAQSDQPGSQQDDNVKPR